MGWKHSCPEYLLLSISTAAYLLFGCQTAILIITLKYRIMKKLLILAAAVMIVMGCEDFLVEEPKTQIAVDQYFEKAEDARAAVNALYRDGSGANAYGSGGFRGSDIMVGVYMSGLFDNEGKGERIEGQLAHSLQQDPVNFNDYAGGWWNAMFRTINRANLAIDRIPGIEMNAAEKNRLLAEARYFRAHNYFTLVKYFGDVPLTLLPIEGLANAFIPRSSSAEVYAQIITDLEWALSNGNLPDVPFNSGNNGRVTRGAVLTTLAQVHLQRSGFPLNQNAYADAAAAARQVINSGTYALVQHGADPLTESAYNIMRVSEQEREYIWSAEYDGDVANSGYPRITIPGAIRFNGLAYSRTLNMYRPIDTMVNMYTPDLDLRIQNKQLFATTTTDAAGNEIDLGEYAPFLWYEETAIFQTERGSKNLNHTRYPEVLLIAAEAIARSQGVTAEAVGYLADVRDRAYWTVDRADIVASLSGLSVDAFVQEVWKERYKELALDFSAWHDIQRTRQYPISTTPGVVTFRDVIGADNNWGVQFRERDLLYPIPDAEMQRNDQLTQNPGY
ncbi:MAG: RagB/SusD family nutrient uptake outer membrane protein [Balneolaceae bacterium]|nr:MAG: RagB/SusD family nutrient uptake outer membrane protein [Balneolaceae bacterium]